MKRRRKTFEQAIAEAKEHIREIQSRTSDNDTYTVIAFDARGFNVETIIPRVTTLVYDAWIAYGRHVRKGEKAVAVPTYKPRYRKNDAGQWEQVTRTTKNGEEKPALVPTTAYLFHIAQTDPYDKANADFWPLTPAMDAALRLSLKNPPPAIADPQDDDRAEEPAPLPLTISYGSTVIHRTAPEESDEQTDAANVAAGIDRFGMKGGRRTPGPLPLFSA